MFAQRGCRKYALVILACTMRPALAAQIISAQAKARVRGTVVASDGSPVTGAQVWAILRPDKSGGIVGDFFPVNAEPRDGSVCSCLPVATWFEHKPRRAGIPIPTPFCPPIRPHGSRLSPSGSLTSRALWSGWGKREVFWKARLQMPSRRSQSQEQRWCCVPARPPSGHRGLV